MSTTATPRSQTGIVRWASLAGVVYVVLFVIGVLLLFAGTPDTGSAPGKIISWYGDSGHRDRMSIGWVLAGLAMFFFLWFLGALRAAVRRLEGDDGYLTAITTIGGGIYAALTLAALGLEVGIKTMSDDTYHHLVYPPLIHAADDAGWLLHASGGAGAAAMILAASIAALQTRAVPTWLGWLSVVAGILTLGLIIFFPWFVLAVWVLVVSIGLFIRGGRAPAATTTA